MSGDINDGITVPIELAKNSEAASAAVKSCTSKRIQTGSRRHNRIGQKFNKTIYAMEAVTNTGDVAIGSFASGWFGPNWCESKIGETVTIRLHPTDPSLNRISSFTQLWYPLLQIALTLFWALIISHIRPLAWTVFGANLIILPLIFKSVGML